MNDIIGIDFSINKPAACILSNNKYHFISWPYSESLKEELIWLYRNAGVEVLKRVDVKLKKGDSTQKMRWELDNSEYITQLIVDSLDKILKKKPYIIFEGLSYGSGGNSVTQLAGYKYLLMSKFKQYVPTENMYTYAPISLKKTAGCAKKGSKKKDIVDSFVDQEKNVDFVKYINRNRESFLKKGGKNWIDHLDDFVDSYFLIKTFLEREIN